MEKEKKINILVLPDLFPEFENDIKGVFFYDFLRSIECFCNITVLYVRLKGNKGVFEENYKGFKVIRVNITSGSTNRLSKLFYYLIWFIKGYKIAKTVKDIDIVHSLVFGAALNGTLGYIVSRKLKKPFVISENFGPFSDISKKITTRLIAKFIMERAGAVTAVSEHLKNEILESGISPVKIDIIYNPVDTALFDLAKKNTIENKNFIFVARLDENKGALRTIKAFYKIFEKHKDWTFTVIGDGKEMKNILDFLKDKTEFSNNIKLEGRKNKNEVRNNFRSSDFFVYPSLFESFSLVLAEALSSGLPVIAGNKTAPVEYIDKSCGLLVDAMNTDEIAEAIEWMMANHNSFDPSEIRFKIIEKFGFEIFGKRVFNIYQNLLNTCVE